MATFIICAFGPSAATKGACRRALALAGPRGRVVVFRSNRLAQLPSRGGDRRLTLIDAAGTPALRQALEHAGDDTVVFLHDDVLLLPDVLNRLVAEAERTGRLCVPHSNDQGLPQFSGPLPEVRGGAGALRGAMRMQPRVGMTTAKARGTCIVGSAARVRALADRGLHRARLLVSAPLDPFVVPAGAVVTHDGTCSHRLAAPEGPDSRPLLVASMIVRDEERMLPDCLASLAPLVDRVDICDTGSRDGTIEIARAFGAQVIERRWRDDFAWARNEALALSRDAWFVLQVDADERVRCDDPTAVRQRLATAVDDDDAFTVAIHNLEVAGESKTVHHATRLFRPAGMAYVSALHEAPRATSGPDPIWTDLEGLVLDHYGYDLGIVAERDKHTRNVAVAKAEYERAPSATAARNYARALTMAGGDPQEIIDLFEVALGDNLGPAVRAMTLAGLGEAQLACDRPADALRSAEEALALVPSDSWSATVHARAALELDQPEKVLQMAAASRSAPSVDAAFASEDYAREAALLHATACARIGQVRAALDIAAEVMATGAPLPIHHVRALVLGLLDGRRGEAVAELADLATLDRNGSICAILADVLTDAELIEVCAGAAGADACSAEVLRLGLLAALRSGDWLAAVRFTQAAGRLDRDVRAQLAADVEGNGLASAATAVRTGASPDPAAWDIDAALWPEDGDTLTAVLAITDAAVVSVPVPFETLPGMPMTRWVPVAQRTDGQGRGHARVCLPTQAAAPARPEDELVAVLAAGQAGPAVDALARMIAAAQDEDRAVVLRWLAVALFENGSDTEAGRILDQSLAVFPDYTDLWYLRWLFAAVLGHDDAEAADKVRRLGPATGFVEHLADPAGLMAERLAGVAV